MKVLELLAPAGSADIAIEAVKHGADAVYIGPQSHGARKSAANSSEEIKRAVDFAHIYGARVYAAVNTLVYDSELRGVERMIRELYEAGVDAIIAQDMGILRMDLPPIALHASTQCDIRTPEKALFLQEAGFSQLVLARELSVDEIGAICRAVTVPVETFVHGALCVSYSGRCSAGFACAGRSGNRGECPQICRQAFTLRDSSGRVLAKDKYLLSLKDFRADRHLDALVDAGVSSFKIEGRLKEAAYVKNVTAYYSRLLDDIINRRNSLTSECEARFRRESFGKVDLSFTPDVEKSFNRGFTSYRLGGDADKEGLASMITPKSLGEKITDVHELRPGDGISFLDRDGRYTGAQVNAVNPMRNGASALSLFPSVRLPNGVEIRRTSSVEWKKVMARETATRLIPLDITLDATGLTAVEHTDYPHPAFVRIAHDLAGEEARHPTDYSKVFGKLGGTPFSLNEFHNEVPEIFFPLSALTTLRRRLVERLLSAKRATYRFDYRREENADYPYPSKTLDYRDNVANGLAEEFYRDHGVEKMERALEVRDKTAQRKGLTVMTTRHCILRELGLCLKTRPDIKMPLSLESGPHRFTAQFDCSRCEMNISI